MKTCPVVLLLVGLAGGQSVPAQQPVLAVGGGTGVILRDERQGSVGIHLSLSGHLAVHRGVLIGVELLSDSYAPWRFANELCPVNANCAAPNTHRTNVNALLVTAVLRSTGDSTGGSPVYPILGAGIYGVDENQKTVTSLGVTAGLGGPLARNLFLEARYNWVRGDARISSFLPLSIVWRFK